MLTVSLVISLICVVIICGLTIYVTKKAYSKKWDQDDDDKIS